MCLEFLPNIKMNLILGNGISLTVVTDGEVTMGGKGLVCFISNGTSAKNNNTKNQCCSRDRFRDLTLMLKSWDYQVQFKSNKHHNRICILDFEHEKIWGYFKVQVGWKNAFYGKTGSRKGLGETLTIKKTFFNLHFKCQQNNNLSVFNVQIIKLYSLGSLNFYVPDNFKM